MDMSYSIQLEKHKDYKRFNLHNIIADVNRFGEFSIEFYEDVEETLEGIQYNDEGEVHFERPEYDAKRVIYAGATLHIHRVPDIIQALQDKLEAYQNFVARNGEGDETDS